MNTVASDIQFFSYTVFHQLQQSRQIDANTDMVTDIFCIPSLHAFVRPVWTALPSASRWPSSNRCCRVGGVRGLTSVVHALQPFTHTPHHYICIHLNMYPSIPDAAQSFTAVKNRNMTYVQLQGFYLAHK